MANKKHIESGSEVWLPNSASLGTIVELLDECTALVEVDGDLIPVDFDFIEPAPKKEAAPKPVLEEPLKTTDPKAAKRSSKPDSTGHSTSGKPNEIWKAPIGMQLMFVPQTDREYKIVLSNNTPHQYLFQFEERAARKHAGIKHGRIEGGQQKPLGFMEVDRLNDNPSYFLEFWHIKEGSGHGGTERPWSREVKLKASSFFKQAAKVGQSEEAADGVCFMLFNDLPRRADRISADLPKNLRKQMPSFEDSPWREYEQLPGNVLAKAMMPDFIDLHAEKLVQNPKQYDKGELLELQLKACRSFLEKAIVFHLPKVWLVHGFGSGRLKDEITKMLKELPEIKGFENTYNHRFGFGATEVSLGGG